MSSRAVIRNDLFDNGNNHNCEQHEKSTVIRNPKSNLVLDATETHVKLQSFTGIPAQLWTFECIDQGRFIIKNNGTRKVLDVDGGVQHMNKVITSDRHYDLSQEWYVNSDGTICSPAPPGNLVLDIFYEKYQAGTNIVVYPKHLKQNQIFRLDYQ